MSCRDGKFPFSPIFFSFSLWKLRDWPEHNALIRPNQPTKIHHEKWARKLPIVLTHTKVIRKCDHHATLLRLSQLCFYLFIKRELAFFSESWSMYKFPTICHVILSFADSLCGLFVGCFFVHRAPSLSNANFGSGSYALHCTTLLWPMNPVVVSCQFRFLYSSIFVFRRHVTSILFSTDNT